MNTKGLGGRPRTYTDPEEVAEKINDFFLSIQYERTLMETIKNPQYGHPEYPNAPEYIEVAQLNRKGQPITVIEWARRPLLIDLCIHLGMSRSTYHEYQTGKYDEPGRNFSDIFAQAKAVTESFLANALHDNKQARGAEFNLASNYGWDGKKGGDMVINLNQIAQKDDGDINDRLATLQQKMAMIEGESKEID